MDAAPQAKNPTEPGRLEVDEARAILVSGIDALPAEEVPLAAALDRIFAQDILATTPLPGFDNSAMDGYALGPGDRAIGSEWRVTGEQPAGAARPGCLVEGEAWRIFTGAPLPDGATAVVMQEEIERLPEGRVRLLSEVGEGEFIRRAGTDVCPGQLVARAGDIAGPLDLGLLASQGLARVNVRQRPSLRIITTGNECRPADQALMPGEIRESNGAMLAALALRAGADPDTLTSQHIGDQRQALREACSEALRQCDLLILSGGVSVGDHDHVRPVLTKLGCTCQVQKLHMKPGKPFVFARHPSGTLVCGLPGNPVSSAATFHLLVASLMRALVGQPADPPSSPGLLVEHAVNQADRPHYLRVRMIEPPTRDQPLARLAPVGRQGSDALGGLARSDGLLRLGGKQELEAGSRVDWLPWQ